MFLYRIQSKGLLVNYILALALALRHMDMNPPWTVCSTHTIAWQPHSKGLEGPRVNWQDWLLFLLVRILYSIGGQHSCPYHWPTCKFKMYLVGVILGPYKAFIV